MLLTHQALADTPQPEYRGKDPHGNPVDELQGRLLVALGYDDVAEVRLLLQAGAQVRDRDSDGGTVPHYAVSRTDALDLIRYFASRGADVNARGWDNETPLFVAFTYFNELGPSGPAEVMTGGESGASGLDSEAPSAGEVVALLIELGADIDAVDDFGNTLLMQCVVADNGESTAREIAYELGRRVVAVSRWTSPLTAVNLGSTSL